jgi:[acyl-carrier-protein] S-malonyltransferase
MGSELRGERPELFDRYFALAEEASGLPVAKLALEGPLERLTETDAAQPALFALSLALAEAAGELGLEPALLAGHSLGEYTAAVAAGALPLEQGMGLVAKRGRLMAEIQSTTPGTMAAIIGLGRDDVERLCAAASELGQVGLANLNSPRQIVVSGEERAVERVVELAEEAGAKRAMRLQVGAAFHSPMMEPVGRELGSEMDAITFSDPRVPIVSNASGQVVRTAKGVRSALVDQIAHPVQWASCVETLVGENCRTFLELGPGHVLGGLVRQLDRSLEVSAAESVAKLSEIAAGLDQANDRPRDSTFTNSSS